MKKLIVLCIILTNNLVLFSASYYVSSNASPNGNGTILNPWTFQTALNQPSTLHPGDTVWMRGGLYKNLNNTDPSYGKISYVCNTNGTNTNPIIFRNYNNERVTIDGELNQIVLFLGGVNNFSKGCSYTWFWGMEFMSSDTIRTPSRAFIECEAPNIKFINLCLHDMADGIDIWNPAKSGELYGCLIYHNGWDDATQAHGHGIYTQNDTTNTRLIHNNIFFSSYAYNVKLWSTAQGIDNYDIRNNIVFNGGAASQFSDSRMHNFFIVNNNPARPTRNLVMKHNYTYAGICSSVKGLCNNIGANYGADNMLLDSNYFLGQLRLTAPFTNFSATGNTIYGGTPLNYIVTFGTIDWTSWKNTIGDQNVPTKGLEYFLIPNKYEAERANLAIYNWEELNEVNIDIQKLGWRVGDEFELINVMDYYNDRIKLNVPSNGLISVPMKGHSFSRAIGGIMPAVSQFPKFGAFVLMRTGKNIATSQNGPNNFSLVKIYPNPATYNFQIEINDSRLTELKLRIFDANGIEVMEYPNAVKVSRTQCIEIKTEDWHNGIYFINLIGQGFNQVYKIMIAK